MRRFFIGVGIFVSLALPLGAISPQTAGAVDPVAASDVAQSAGLSESVSTWSANATAWTRADPLTPLDYNRDGAHDFMLVRHNRFKEANGATASLYANSPLTGGQFAEAIQFASADRHDCAWADVNQDTLVDMFCSIGADNGTATSKANELWIQQLGGGFEDRAVAYGVADELGRGRYATFVDVNHDPFPDLFLGNFYPRKDGLPSPNRLFINENGTGFRDAPEYGVDNEVGAFCAQAVDYDRDSWEDLLVCGKQGMKLYHNDEGLSYTNTAGALKLTGVIWLHAVMADFNGDLRPDLARVKENRLQVKLQGTNGFFSNTVINRATVAGESLAVGDVNRDGRLDLYVVHTCTGTPKTNIPDEMLINNGSGTGFSPMEIPQASTGCGDVAEPIDYDKNGTDDFIVLNGNKRSIGPVQLISFS